MEEVEAEVRGGGERWRRRREEEERGGGGRERWRRQKQWRRLMTTATNADDDGDDTNNHNGNGDEATTTRPPRQDHHDEKTSHGNCGECEFGQLRSYHTPVVCGLAHSTKLCWALSDQKGMSYLAKKRRMTKRANTDHKSYKKV